MSDVEVRENRGEELSVEDYFLRYAFPCSFITLQRGRISQGEYEELERAAHGDGSVTREKLEKIFSPAIRRMKKLALEKGMRMWSMELLRAYYWKRHNEIIEAREESYAHAPEVLCELCRIVEGVVVGAPGVGDVDRAWVVKLSNGKTRPVMSLCGLLKVGDRVMVHYGYACEKISRAVS